MFGFIKPFVAPSIYISGIFLTIWTLFKRAEWGLFLMVALIPLPNIWVKMYDYPSGKDFLDFVFLAVLIGVFINGKGLVKTENSIPIFLLILVSYLALWNSSMNFNLPLPLTTSSVLLKQWKDYAQMIFLYFLVVSAVRNTKQQKSFVVLMALMVLFISIRSYRAYTGGASFHPDSRYEGPFWATGLGSNHFGAFIAYSWAAFLGLLLMDNDRKRKLVFLGTVLFAIHPIFFSYSRGAYLAALGALAAFGLLKKRSMLIVLLVLVITWKTLLPASVVDRVMMTTTDSGELEHSAAVRLVLWRHAMGLFEQNPVFGVGFGAFGLTVPKDLGYTDSHNVYLKVLSEQGIVGLSLLLFIFYRALRSSVRLMRMGRTPFQRGLGLGFLGCIVAMLIANGFGDRWSYFAVGGYFWVLWGLVDKGIALSSEKGEGSGEDIEGSLEIAKASP